MHTQSTCLSSPHPLSLSGSSSAISIDLSPSLAALREGQRKCVLVTSFAELVKRGVVSGESRLNPKQRKKLKKKREGAK